MSRLDVRLLGGFEVWHDNQPISGFESQKVRALLAYLMLHAQSAQSRDQLAGLLWPEKDDETARRNLRQALYNLRTTLPHGDAPSPPILTTHQSVQFNPDTDYWLDVHAFEDGIMRGMSAAGGVDPHHLAGATELYRGDFLAGFFVKDSLEFEHWLLYEQERLREMAIQAFRRLVDYYLACGVYPRGIRYARRLLEIDPLLEEVHRNLMRLYALSDQRSQALVQYQECRDLLQAELGVDPLEETTALYEAILADEWPARPMPGEYEPTGPRIPFVGRRKAHVRLNRSWDPSRHSTGRLILIEGEAGIGKTRLVEVFIGDAASRTRVLILRGTCFRCAPRVSYQPFADALKVAVAEHASVMRQVLTSMPSQWLAELALLAPELSAMYPDLPAPASPTTQGIRRPLFQAVVQLLKALTQFTDAGQAMSVILFLDDLQWADQSSLELLQYLVDRLPRLPIWIVGTCQSSEIGAEHPLPSFCQQLGRYPNVDRVALSRLSAADIDRIAAAVVDVGPSKALARFLDRESAGLPLSIRELVNGLIDHGSLVSHQDGRWTVAGPLPHLAIPTPDNPRHLIMDRVSQLPTSVRRLLTLAAVVGPRFDAELLNEAAGEHMAVVNASIDVLLERRMIRLVPWQWSEGIQRSGQDGDNGLNRFETFEFAHDEIRLAIYEDVNPARRRVMHQQIAEALERRYEDDTSRVTEVLAYHYVAAAVWDRAFPYLKQAADTARCLMARETARYYYDLALYVLDRLESSLAKETERQTCRRERSRILANRSEMGGSVSPHDRRIAELGSVR